VALAARRLGHVRHVAAHAHQTPPIPHGSIPRSFPGATPNPARGRRHAAPSDSGSSGHSERHTAGGKDHPDPPGRQAREPHHRRSAHLSPDVSRDRRRDGPSRNHRPPRRVRRSRARTPLPNRALRSARREARAARRRPRADRWTRRRRTSSHHGRTRRRRSGLMRQPRWQAGVPVPAGETPAWDELRSSASALPGLMLRLGEAEAGASSARAPGVRPQQARFGPSLLPALGRKRARGALLPAQSGSAIRMAASTAPGRKEVFLEAIFRIVARIQKPVVGSYRDGTYACSGAEASVIVSRLTPDQWHTSPNQAYGTSLPAARRSACSAASMCR
jgi:hypothetical protein